MRTGECLAVKGSGPGLTESMHLQPTPPHVRGRRAARARPTNHDVIAEGEQGASLLSPREIPLGRGAQTGSQFGAVQTRPPCARRTPEQHKADQGRRANGIG